jgi:high-affinity iron transporter
LREGSEIVLFLYGIAISGSDTAATMAAGGLLGLALGATMAAMMYLGLLRIPSRHLFRVTSWLIALLAAGMAAQAMAFLQQADIVTALSRVVWNTSTFVSHGSVTGKVLHTLIGYTDRPTGLQLVAYVCTLVAIFTLMRLFGPVAGRAEVTRPGPSPERA